MCAVQVLEHLEYVEDVVSEVAYCLKLDFVPHAADAKL